MNAMSLFNDASWEQMYRRTTLLKLSRIHSLKPIANVCAPWCSSIFLSYELSCTPSWTQRSKQCLLNQTPRLEADHTQDEAKPPLLQLLLLLNDLSEMSVVVEIATILEHTLLC